MISKKIGIVVEIADSSEVLDDIRVNVNGQIQRAYNYTKLTGKTRIESDLIGAREIPAEALYGGYTS